MNIAKELNFVFENWKMDKSTEDIFCKTLKRYIEYIVFHHLRQEEEDVIGDILLAVWYNLVRGGYSDEKAGFSTWVFSIAKNKCSDYLREFYKNDPSIEASKVEIIPTAIPVEETLLPGGVMFTKCPPMPAEGAETGDSWRWQMLGRTQALMSIEDVQESNLEPVIDSNCDSKLERTQAVERLKPLERELYNNIIEMGYSFEEIAAQTGESEAALWKRWERTKDKLRERLTRSKQRQ
jgi:RNA polymerase sigma factor (sigma-70 family)